MTTYSCWVCRMGRRMVWSALCIRCARRIPARHKRLLEAYYPHRVAYASEWDEVLAAARQWHLYNPYRD